MRMYVAKLKCSIQILMYGHKFNLYNIEGAMAPSPSILLPMDYVNM